LVIAGRGLFGRYGFAATSIEDLAREAGVTRGALYHHFKTKEDLFQTVFEQLELELVTASARAAAEGKDAWRRLTAGCLAFLRETSDPAVQRTVLIDAPSVLGWEKWRMIEERYAIGVLRAGLQAAVNAGSLQGRDVETLTHMLLGALTEAAMVLASGVRTPQQVYGEVEALLSALENQRHS
jgi:AcrR family transcriptional regulator